MEQEEGFGPHLAVDLAECDSGRLSDFELIFDLLNNLPDMIGMTKITQPYVFKYKGLVPEDLGITGTVIIAESHLSIHTFPLKGFCFADIFSCRSFDYKKAEDHFIRTFLSKKPECQVLFRGRHFPRTSILPK